MAKLPWLKLYTEIRTDPKMQVINDAEFRVWINLLCLAAESKYRGIICIDEGVPYPIEALARALFTDPDSLKIMLDKFSHLQMVEVDSEGIVHILHFDERQYDKPSDRPEKVADRVRRHRQAKIKEGNADVTLLKRQCNDTDIDVDRDKDTEKDKDDDADLNAPAREENLVNVFEQEFGRLPSPNELDNLNSFITDGVEEPVICEAIRRTRLQGKVNVRYAVSILNSWLNAGVTTMSGVSRVDLEFEEAKLKGGRKNVRTGKARGDPDPYDPEFLESLVIR